MQPFLPAALLAALVVAAPAHAAAAGLPLVELARAVSQADALSRLDFALVTLDEMALAYRAEAERVHEERRPRAGADSKVHWSSVTGAYADELDAMLVRAHAAEAVEVLVDATGEVMLVVDGSPIAVAGPRVAEPGLLGGAIVGRFCRLHDCAWLLPARAPRPASEQPPRPAPAPAVEWQFSERGGALCRSDDGFEFLFRKLDRIPAKRAACARVIGEFRRVAGRLAALRLQGVRVDLQWLSIAPLASGPGHRLTLNAEGAYTRLPLPALASVDGLLRAGLPWLDAQAREVSGSLRLSNAGATLAPALLLAAGEPASR